MSIGPELALEMSNLYRALGVAGKTEEKREPTEDGLESEAEELVSERGTGVSEQEMSSNRGS